ncbi:MAG: hypothetical protein GQ570_08110 [Helicobacteraceae bacterium]|nr:hypothetical protein [Helicobacteraceae bacterium]
MQEFERWTLETIRGEGASLNWLEESRFEWSATTYQALSQILQAKTVILITDEPREWLSSYILSSINKPGRERPIIPIVSLKSLYPNYDNITGGAMIDMLEDMLSTSFNDNYFFFYIGKGDDRRADIAKRNDKSYLWMMDDDFSNALILKSYDPLIDIKLMQLFRLFDITLSAALFAEVNVGE